MRYYILTGEASGDQHASHLIRALSKKDDRAEFRFWGGDLMSAAVGEKPVKHIRELAFMGFWEVAVNLKTILKNFKLAKKDILEYRPDVLILVDYPGFNLRMAEWAKKRGLKTVFYIAPQVWAWKENRVKKIKKYTDKLLTILPFEEPYFKDKGVEQAVFVGNPLLDHFDRFQPNNDGFDQGTKYFGIFPGSRKQEVKQILPPISSVFDKFPNTEFGLSKSSQLAEEDALYAPYVENKKNVHIYTGRQYDLLSHCYAGLVKSGTSTLEAALLGVPQAVVYKTSPLSYHIARQVVKVKYISLVNLILDEPLIEEYIQSDLNPKRVADSFKKLHDEGVRSKILDGYERLRNKLGRSGCSERAAAEILSLF